MGKKLNHQEVSGGLDMKHHAKYRALDGIKSSPGAERKLPWWIREVDKPTVDIDWSRMKRFDCTSVMFNNGFAEALGRENAMKLGGRAIEASTRNILEDEPAFSLKEKALVAAGWLTSLLTEERAFLGPGLNVPFTMEQRWHRKSPFAGQTTIPAPAMY